MIVIPSIDLHKGYAVKRIRGIEGSEVVMKNPLDVINDLISNYEVERIHIVDLDGAKFGKPIHFDIIKKLIEIAKEHNVKVQVGGGIRYLEHALMYSKLDADVVISSIVFENTIETKKIINTIGSDKIFVSVDIKDGKISIHGWLKKLNLEILSYLNELDIRKIIYTCIDVEGMLKGIKIYPDVIQKLKSLNISELIYAGGVKDEQDIEILHRNNFTGVIVGMAYYMGYLKRLIEFCKRLKR